MSADGTARAESLRLVMWSHSGELAGAELCLLELVQALHDGEHDVDVHVVAPWPGSLTERLELMVPVSLLPSRWWVRPVRPSFLERLVTAIRIVWSVARAVVLIRRLRADVVVTNSLVAPAGAIAARLLGVPHIWYVHEFGAQDHDFSFVFGARATLRAVERLSRVIVTNSEDVRTTLFPESDKAVVSASGVDVPDDVLAHPTDKGRLLLLGQVRPSKGHPVALHALRRLHDSGHDYALTIAGSGPADYRLELDELVRELGLTDSVRFLPQTDDPFRLMQEHDVLLMCSRREALGRVVIEAMKIGLPVVAGSTGTSGLLVSEGRGWCYEPGDSESLAAGVTAALSRGRGDETTVRAREWARAMFRSDRYAADLLRAVGRP